MSDEKSNGEAQIPAVSISREAVAFSDGTVIEMSELTKDPQTAIALAALHQAVTLEVRMAQVARALQGMAFAMAEQNKAHAELQARAEKYMSPEGIMEQIEKGMGIVKQLSEMDIDLTGIVNAFAAKSGKARITPTEE